MRTRKAEREPQCKKRSDGLSSGNIILVHVVRLFMARGVITSIGSSSQIVVRDGEGVIHVMGVHARTVFHKNADFHVSNLIKYGFA